MLRNNLKTVFILIATTFILASCGPTTVRQIEEKHNALKLTPEKVLQLVEGNTLLLVSFNEDSYIYFDKSGRVYGLDIYENKDIGKWDVADSGELCIKLQRWWRGDLKCFAVYSDGNRISLSNNTGVIVFNATKYSGDYKKQYYEPKKPKQSYRKSIRKKHSAIQEEDPQITKEKLDSQNKQTGKDRTPSHVSDAELKSTVKWMAKDCPGCNLANSNLKKADLVGAKLAGANLSGANLSMADMRRANLQSANLENANLQYTNMPGANLRNCNLRNANLKGVNLIRADLTGADLKGAILDDALLEGALGID